MKPLTLGIYRTRSWKSNRKPSSKGRQVSFGLGWGTHTYLAHMAIVLLIVRTVFWDLSRSICGKQKHIGAWDPVLPSGRQTYCKPQSVHHDTHEPHMALSLLGN